MKQRSIITLAVSFSVACICAANARAQVVQPSPQPSPAVQNAPQTPAANPADVASIDSIIAALYDVISGPAGKQRDWDRFRSLFFPGARLIPTGARRPPGTAPDAPLTGKEEYGSRALTPEDYITRSSRLLEERGFFEREAARRTEQYGHIAHVFSTYESRHKAEDAKPFQRGINSIQLMNDGKRWWVVSVFWEGETEKTPLPGKYLKSSSQ
ncbi:MAG: hypothetical protein QOH25_4041 [Acidobacteriota bacterium]|jgi:hypothetical protein|nr:hypothetical protein [Acidobacteriota bacterium]